MGGAGASYGGMSWAGNIARITGGGTLAAPAPPRYAAFMSDDRTHLEETIAHLSRTVDELSDIIARQETDLAKLRKQVDMLMQREAEREYEAGGSVPLADQKPPHW